MSKSTRAILAFLLSLLSCSVASFAQSNSGAVKGSVLDPSGGAIANATVKIQNAVSKYNQTAQTDAQGNFAFSNVPFNNYHVAITAPGFQSGEQDVDRTVVGPERVEDYASPR